MGRSLMQTDHQTPEGQSTVADAPPDNWVDRYAPPDWRPWLRLSRADRPIGTWLLLLPCWWGIGLAMIADHPQWHDLWIAVACGAGAVLMRGAGCTWNDITDRDIDDKVARTRSRPIPSGQVTVTGALVWLAAQALAGFAILLTLGAAVSHNTYALGNTFKALDAVGRSSTAELNLRYPWVRSVDFNVYAQVGYEYRKLKDDVRSTSTVTEKHANVGTLSAFGDARDGLGRGGLTQAMDKAGQCEWICAPVCRLKTRPPLTPENQ